MKQFTYLFIFIILFTKYKTNAQIKQYPANDKPLYQVGKIYLKIKLTSNTAIHKKDSIINDFGSSILTVFNQFGVTKTEKPFAILNDANLNKTYRITFTDTSNTSSFISALQQINSIEYAEKVPAMYSTAVPNDQQPYHLALVNANLASNIHIATGNAIVAIVDDAVLTTHEDLAANIGTLNRDVADLDNDPNPPFTGTASVNGSRFSHGTHVAGIAGAVTNNGIGVASVGWNNKLMCVKTRGNSDTSDFLPFAYDGLAWAAANGAHVINMSWGSYAYSLTEYSVVVAAKNMNIVLIAAVGNDNTSSYAFPAAYGEGGTGQTWEIHNKNLVVAVASLDASNDISNWGPGLFAGTLIGSNYGDWVDISAYGTNILSTIANSSAGSAIINQYGSFNGTSMAAPIVSGIAGVMRSYDMTKTADEIINCLLYTANADIYNTSLHPNNILGKLGTGHVDAEAALRCLGVNCSNNPVAIITPSSFNLCPSGTVTLTTNQGVSYLWSTGATTQSISINTAGIYTVTVTFNGGCVSTKTINIQPANTQAHIYFAENSGIAPNDGVLCGIDFLNSYTDYGLSYTWNIFFATGQSISLFPGSIINLPSTQYMSVTVSGIGGCVGVVSTATANAHWLLPPSINVSSSPSIICASQPATLFASGANSYTWQPSNLNTNQLNINLNTNTTYTVIGKDVFGCLNSQTFLVSLNNSEIPICLGESTQLNTNNTCVNLSTGYTYNWTPSTNLSCSTCQSPIANPTTTTIYTLVATSTNPLQNSGIYTFTVSIKTPEAVIIDQISFANDCAGRVHQLNCFNNTTYTWSPCISNCNNFYYHVYPTQNTTYTCSITGANGCVSSAVITVTVPPIPIIPITIVNPTCPSTNYSLSTTNALTYTWTPSGANTPSITVNPTTATIYSVATTNSLGCISTGSIILNPSFCCSIAGGLNLTTTTGTITGATLNLNAPLTLTGNLNLIGVKLFMGSNAEIIIPNGFKLYIERSHLLGCPTMWKGIRCLGSSASIVVTKNSLIEDAITAIDVKNVTTPAPSGSGRILSIDDATFNKNYTAINIDTYNSTAGNYPLFLQNTVFTSRKLITPDHVLVTPSLTPTYNWPTANNMANLKTTAIPTNLNNPDNQLQTNYEFSVASYSTSNLEYPNNGSIAHQGIYVKDVYSLIPANYNGLRIGASAFTNTTLNVFDNMHFGINGLNSNINSSNAAYQYMQQYTLPCEFIKCIKTFDGGVGINSISNLANGAGSTQTFSLTVYPNNAGYNNSSNFFINCAYGVKFTNIEYANIQYAIFHSKRIYTPPSLISFCCFPIPLGEYGVFAKTVDYRGININNNFTANINKAIIFTADYSLAFGAFRVQYAGALTINNNTLKANYGNTLSNRSMEQAIAVDNLLNQTTVGGFVVGSPNTPIFIANNNISKTFRGIAVSNWNSQRVIDNSNYITLVDNLVTASSQYGIGHQNNTGDNIIANTIIGFGNTKVVTTAIGAKENKRQTMWCNSTDNTYSGVTFIGAQNFVTWRENKMKNHIHGMELSNTTIGTQGAVGQPINNQWLGSWPTGTSKTYVKTLDPATTSTLTGTDSKLYLNNPPSITQNGENPIGVRYKTTAPQSLFLTSGPGLNCPVVANGGVGTSTLNGMSNFIGNLANIINNGYAYGTFLNGNRKNGKIATFRALMQEPALLIGNPTLQSFYTANANSAIGKLTQTETQLSTANIANAQTMVNSVIPTDTVEQNTKHFYQIYIKSKLGTYSNTDDADLQALANACPLKEGVAVYQARVLLNSLYDVYYHYEDNCPVNASSARIGHSQELDNTIVNDNFIVYPNPSTGTIYFTAKNMGIDAYSVTVYDVNGRVIFEKSYTDDAEVNTLNLNLSSGVYMMQLNDTNTNDIYKQKIVIQK